MSENTYDFPVVNAGSELSDCAAAWFFDDAHRCWCLEDILYTQAATTPKFQRMSIFVPGPYLSAPGIIDPEGRMGKFTAQTAPVIFENNSGGYMQMPHTWLGGPRDESEKYLARGMVYVTCGCRGHDSRDREGRPCGKSPWTLVDLKTAIRFLRHNAAALPGDFGKIVSVGFSAGGAMSALLGVTGNAPRYEKYLAENGAFMEERDDVYAAQVYCPITDLDHADLAYEWQFRNDRESEPSPAGPGGPFTPFQSALSAQLAAAYAAYFNGLGLTDPATGHALTLEENGHGGSAYAYLMARLEDSATEFLSRLDCGALPVAYGVADYLSGNYTYKVKKLPFGPGKKDEIGLHHAGPGAALPPELKKEHGGEPPSLGEILSRPPKGTPYRGLEFPTEDAPGTDKRAWLRWDGKRASITSLDDYLRNHRRRMKPCPAFDALGKDSAENREFATPEAAGVHFDAYIAPAFEALRERFPEEYAEYRGAYAAVEDDEALSERKYLLNPMNFIGGKERCDSAAHFRVRVGAQDADAAFTVSMALALKLAQAGKDVDYALVWDQPHCEADYPGAVCDWIEGLCER